MKLMHKALVLAAMTFAVSAQAEQIQATPAMDVSATIVANCTAITTGDIVFGEVDQGVSDSTDALINVVCGNLTDYSIGVEAGQNYNNGTRRMLATVGGASFFLPYALSNGSVAVGTNSVVDFPTYTPAINGAAAGNVITGTGDGTATGDDYTITGDVTAADTLLAPAGSYTDMVVVGVAF